MNPLAIQRSVPSSVSNIVVPKIGTIIPNRIFVGGISSTVSLFQPYSLRTIHLDHRR